MEVAKSSSHWSWIIALVVSSALMSALFVLGWRLSDLPQEKYLTCGILIAAGACGWVAGMLLSPDSKVEATNFSTAGKSVSLFVSGYLVSKIDGVVTAVFEPALLLQAPDHLAAYRLVAAVAMMILAAILAYVLRIYAFTVG